MTLNPCKNCPYRNHSQELVLCVAADSELQNPCYLRDLKAAMRWLKLPRRQWANAIEDALREFDGDLLNPDGTDYLASIYTAFADDPDFRWVSEFMKPCPKGHEPRLQKRSLERARLIDLYFRIRHRALAYTFGKFAPANDNNPDDA